MERTNARWRGAATGMLLLITGTLPMGAGAALIVTDTFGPGDSYDTGGRFGVDGIGDFQAFLFTPTASGALEQITVAIGRESVATTQTRFELFDGTAGALGTLLETFDIANNVAPGQTPGAVVSFGSLAQPVLTAGQIYWLSYSEPDAADQSSSLWFFNDQGLTGTRLTSALPAQTNILPAFRIEVADVSEPAAALLLMVGLVGCALGRRRRSDRTALAG